ncbi:MAG: glycosyltransferase family 4 protein, partial [bacterium]
KRGNEIFFGYTGRIEKEKGVYVLLEAFIEVVKTFNNFRLFLVGAGNESNYINSIIKKKGLYGRIILCGFYEGDIYDALSAFDVFVFPSLWEGVPYAILDSMNAGNIIISTNVGGIPEVITDGVDGFLIPPCNVEELVNCMKRVGCNLENYRLMGDNSKEKIKTKYSSKVFRKNVEYVMVSLINL